MESYRHNILCIPSNVSFIPSLVLITPFVPHKTFLLCYLYFNKPLGSAYCIPNTILRTFKILIQSIFTQSFFVRF